MPPEYADNWQQYWERAIDEGRRDQLERAARDPVSRWVVADAPGLVDEDVGIDPVDLHEHPDDVLAAARDGFERAVAVRDLPRHDDDRYDYEVLPVHVTTLGRVDGVDVSFTAAAPDANRLTTVESAAVHDGPRRRHEAAVLTYVCPLGHETSVVQPLLRSWTVDTCGEPGCTLDVVPDDARTRGRYVVRFAVESANGTLPCVATGRYGTDEAFEQLDAASRLHLTGIPRLMADGSGGLDPTFEVLAAEPAAP